MMNAISPACPHCDAKVSASQNYCEQCGNAVRAPINEIRITRSDSDPAKTSIGAVYQAEGLRSEAVAACNVYGVLAILVAVGLALLLLVGQSRATDSQSPGLMLQLGVVLTMYVGIWWWSRRSPLPASIVGLIFFSSLVLVQFVQLIPLFAMISGPLLIALIVRFGIQALIIGYMIRAVKRSLKAREAMKTLAPGPMVTA